MEEDWLLTVPPQRLSPEFLPRVGSRYCGSSFCAVAGCILEVGCCFLRPGHRLHRVWLEDPASLITPFAGCEKPEAVSWSPWEEETASSDYSSKIFLCTSGIPPQAWQIGWQILVFSWYSLLGIDLSPSFPPVSLILITVHTCCSIVCTEAVAAHEGAIASGSGGST